MNEPGEIVGMVDVLKLTYATLEQINTMSTGESEGPAWNKFWLSIDNESESLMSGEGSHHAHTPHRSVMSPDISRDPMSRYDSSVMPNESASHHGDNSPPHSAVMPTTSPEDIPFPFKFKAPSGRVHRLQVKPSAGLFELVVSVTAKLGGEVDTVGGEATVVDGRLGKSGYALSYVDDEGDTVSITTDRDLVDAISIARHGRREKVDLFVHDPSKPPITATVDPRPGLIRPPTPPPSTLRERKRGGSDEELEEIEDGFGKTRKDSDKTPAKQEIIAGVPNDLLLPGAIATLAVVIVGVFALSRTSNR
jgi:hypothetical protein